MLMVNQLIGFGVSAASLTETLISQGTGTTIGDMTSLGALANLFDGNKNQALASGAATGVAASGYAGKNLGSAKVISGFKVWGTNDHGYYSSENPTLSIKLYAKTSSPSSGTDGTLLGTIGSFTDTAGVDARELLGIANATAYQYVWAYVDASASSGTQRCCFCEVEFYEWL